MLALQAQELQARYGGATMTAMSEISRLETYLRQGAPKGSEPRWQRPHIKEEGSKDEKSKEPLIFLQVLGVTLSPAPDFSKNAENYSEEQLPCPPHVVFVPDTDYTQGEVNHAKDRPRPPRGDSHLFSFFQHFYYPQLLTTVFAANSGSVLNLR
jgi:hypothetical protein